MKLINFKDWINAQESSPFTRARNQAALGLGPDIPLAGINSHDTARPWQVERLTKKHKRHKRKKKSE